MSMNSDFTGKDKAASEWEKVAEDLAAQPAQWTRLTREEVGHDGLFEALNSFMDKLGPAVTGLADQSRETGENVAAAGQDYQATEEDAARKLGDADA